MPQWNGLCGADAGTTGGAICGVVVLAWPFEASKSSWSVCVRVPSHVLVPSWQWWGEHR